MRRFSRRDARERGAAGLLPVKLTHTNRAGRANVDSLSTIRTAHRAVARHFSATLLKKAHRGLRPFGRRSWRDATSSAKPCDSFARPLATTAVPVPPDAARARSHCGRSGCRPSEFVPRKRRCKQVAATKTAATTHQHSAAGRTRIRRCAVGRRIRTVCESNRRHRTARFPCQSSTAWFIRSSSALKRCARKAFFTPRSRVHPAWAPVQSEFGNVEQHRRAESQGLGRST